MTYGALTAVVFALGLASPIHLIVVLCAAAGFLVALGARLPSSIF